MYSIIICKKNYTITLLKSWVFVTNGFNLNILQEIIQSSQLKTYHQSAKTKPYVEDSI